MADNSNNKKAQCMSTIVRISVLSWSAALLTASYAGLLSKMDPTFIATVFTAAAATFGVDTLKKNEKDKEEDAKPDSIPATTAVEPIVQPVFDTPVAVEQPADASTIEESVADDTAPSRYSDTEA
jgi:hypothetical protein